MDKNTKLEDVLVTRVANAYWHGADLETIGDLIEYIEIHGIDMIWAVRNIGKKSVQETKDLLDEYGFNWREYDSQSSSWQENKKITLNELSRQINKLIFLLEKYLEEEVNGQTN